MRAREVAALRVFYRSSYDESFVAELGERRASETVPRPTRADRTLTIRDTTRTGGRWRRRDSGNSVFEM